MEKFGLSGLWTHLGSTFLAAGLAIADGLLVYLGNVQMPNWAHALVGVVALGLAAYKGSQSTLASVK